MIRLTRITRKRQSTCLLQCATVVLLGSGEAYMRRDDIIRPRIRTLAPAVRSALPLYPPNIFEPRSEKQLTARADRPGRGPAHAVAFTTAVAIRGAGSVHRRTGMRTARALPVDRNRPGSPPATDCRQNSPPALRPIQTRCFADHRRAWRTAPHLTSRSLSDCDRLRGEWTGWAKSGADRRRFWGAIAGPRQAASVWHLAGHPVPQERRCKMILKEPHARAA